MNKLRHWIALPVVISFTLMLLSGAAAAAPLLKLHAHGHDVKVLQEQLQRLNYTISEIDGVFGRETEKAVLEFQRDQQMKITGSVDGKTWRALKKAKPIVRQPAAENPRLPAAAAVPESMPFLSRSLVKPLVATAKNYIGLPYKFGAAGPKAFDCSGYLQYIFAQNNMTLPRTADEQYKLGKKASRQQLEEGDLVFFSTYEAGASHCGLYLGAGKFIHASSSKGIRIDDLDDDYWQVHYLGGKHIVK